MMSGIRGKDTKPELLIRCGLFRRGFRFRLHAPKLPGKPDIVLPKYKAVILVNGCFWHGHGCSIFKWPSSRPDFWRKKIEANRKHDAESLGALKAQGWRTLVVWECSTKGGGKWPAEGLLDTIAGWVLGGNEYSEIGERHVG
jgi:DNA mismatch endonuclease, patch repair protein